MKKKFALLLVFVLAAATLFAGCSQKDSDDPDVQAYIDQIDIEYSRALMDDLIAFQTNDDLGFRTAGSSAEIAAANYLESQMKEIGLQNVHKEEITVDTFTFKNADLTYNNGTEDVQIEMAMFQTTYKAEGEKVEIVYGGQGTEDDLKDLDVNGKIVVIDIDQYENWWINWPAYQAKVKGAKAIIAVNTSGYCTYSEDTIGVQDFCGPSDAPAFTISVADANPLKAAIEAGGGSITAVLNADGEVVHDGTAYNVYGEIPGQTDEVIYIFAHYDSYFRAFADNTSGTACMMGIAKAMAASGYEPQRTIKFIAHAAEEWGVDDSRYDWARGAEVEMQMHPDWIDTAFVAIDLDSGVTDGASEGVEITVPYELAEWAGGIGKSIGGSPFEGEFLTNSPAWTWTEAFSYTVAGIPVIDSGLYGSDHTGSYHSSSDTEEANNYDPEVFNYAHKLYGGMAILLDKTPAKVFNYAALFDQMAETVDGNIIENADELTAALEEASGASAAFYEACSAQEEMDSDFNKKANYLFKTISNDLFTLDWNEEFQFVHCYKQTNVDALRQAIAALKDGDVATALDEYIWKVDLNWYAYDFDKATYDYYENQVLGPDAHNSWGDGYLQSNADLWQVIQELQALYEAESPDVSAQIKVLEAELAVQEADLAKVVEDEIKTLEGITQTLNELAK